STGAGTPPTITSRMDYHPFGTPHASSPLPTADQKHRYTFCGKEEQRIVTTIPAQYKLAVMDQGARYYIPSTMQFTSQDPLAIKYPHISPYTYCAANPILYIDPTGEEIRATTSSAQVIILNTLNSADLQYVKFNNDGAINKDVINSHSSNSGNFQSLKEIVNSEHMVDVSVANSFTYKTENGDIKIREMGTMQVDNEFDGGSYGLSTKEVGFSGIAQTPGESANKYNSTDNEVRITINSTASIAGQSQILAHELYGHAYLFVKGQEHKHIQFNMTEQNKQLYYKIINSVLETIMNMRK
ncbi:RHS repeat-associated core domain-containing protein, partial [Anaerorhabdus sp.]|uniref:RHS repeat-associated core domain-containing protein n=1 Tax=Anaerorhabdus sp. TaxID=1872524 RepID=UPI002FCBEF5D